MLFTTTPLLALLASTTAVLAAQPPCVQSCITANPTSSWCDGDETGEDLARCTCQSLSGSLMLQCIKKCPEDQQTTYASGLPGSCGRSLFPNLDLASASSSSSASPTPTGTGSGTAESETPAAGGNSDSKPDAAAGLSVPVWILGASILGAGILGL
ncbi:hypothetical protein F4808DRAFT_71868 [Astrocystis sublimbata]|nr:hypothetical protein F4808DRAFT_71868 [Astrocystis sublimbata]